ncbi:hypothetical protein CHARACLAT_028416 [Characodon lateralis]|uniref:Uncharacterized protein n=1 Tax=Characodon lateralis TaxID=208331 RepID=A0ABU7DMC4_9TELE|nr:hypothetical protein [Characodon lateralis]
MAENAGRPGGVQQCANGPIFSKTWSNTVRFGSTTKQDRYRLQQTIWSAERIIRANFLYPCIQDLYKSGKGQLISLQTPNILDKNYSDFYLKDNASEHCLQNLDHFLPQAASLMNTMNISQLSSQPLCCETK